MPENPLAVNHSMAVTAASRIYLMVLGLLVLPSFLRLLGPEAYGLVALSFLLQVWFQLLDLGLTTAIARETARYRAGACTGSELRQLLRSLQLLFAVITGLAGIALMLVSAPVAAHWLQLESMPLEQASQAIQLMALGLMLRLFSELHRSVISGFERFGWLAASAAVFGSMRLIAVLPFMAWVGADVLHFFGFQFVVGALEALALHVKAHRLLPRADLKAVPWSLHPMRRVMRFSAAMSLASVVWVVTSQVDKVVLSGLLTLSDFGAFSLAASAAAAVLVATGALGDTLIPRLTRLQVTGATAEMMSLYRRTSQWGSVLAWSGASMLACHAERILWIWTGDAPLASRTAPVLALYALGNAAMAISAFPFYLQLACGRLRLHLLGTVLMVALLVPGVLWTAGPYGATGAGAVWLGLNALYLAVWTPLIHERFAPGLHRPWALSDVAPAALSALAAGLASQVLPWPDDRLGAGLLLAPVAAAILLAALAGSSNARHWIRSRLGSRLHNTNTVP